MKVSNPDLPCGKPNCACRADRECFHSCTAVILGETISKSTSFGSHKSELVAKQKTSAFHREFFRKILDEIMTGDSYFW